MYVCTCVRMYVHTCMYKNIRVYVHVCIGIDVRTYVHVLMLVGVRVWGVMSDARLGARVRMSVGARDFDDHVKGCFFNNRAAAEAAMYCRVHTYVCHV